jgi:PhoH-like ATPase
VAYDLLKKGERVIFVSKDINARLKAVALGIEVRDFEKQKVKIDEMFSGYREIKVSPAAIEKFYTEKKIRLNAHHHPIYPNEFIVLVNQENDKHSLLTRAKEHNELVELNPENGSAWQVKPRSREQRMVLELLMDDSVSIVTLLGQAGTGKTLLALAAGLEKTLKHKVYDKMLVSRPIMPLGKDLGYMPGDKDEKLINWMHPIFDNLSYLMRYSGDMKGTVREKIEKLQKDHVVELEALTYIRGRSISQQYVIIDEAQNLTPHEIKTIVSRAGEGTKMILTGDPYQIDNPYLDSSSNGLSYAVERLKDQPMHGHVTLKKSERSNLAAIAADLL